jgi:hypothetical protein
MDNETIYAAMDLLRGLKDTDLPQETRKHADALQLSINNERFPHYGTWVGSLPKVSEILHWYFQHKKLTGLNVVSTNGMKGEIVDYSKCPYKTGIGGLGVKYENDTECEKSEKTGALRTLEPHYSDIAFVVDESGYKLPFDTNDRTEGLHRTLYTSLGEKI